MAKVPVISLAGLRSDDKAVQQAVVNKLMKAATDIGFLQVTDHGIPAELIDSMFAQSAKFFSLPLDIKKKSTHDPSRNVGFESFSQIRPSTGLPDNKESIQLAFAGMEGKFPTEEDCPGYESTATNFQNQCFQLAQLLLSAFAVGLGFPQDFFAKAHDVTKEDSQCTLRCLHYPPLSPNLPRGAWRAGSHTDFSTVTLLFQRLGQGGLEVCPGRTAVTDYGVGDVWTPVVPVEDAITINIGDLLMRWSDDILTSNFHRVKMPGVEQASKPRYSIAFFAQPNRSSLVQGLKNKYPPITAGEYVAQAVKPQFEAARQWAKAQADAKLKGEEAAPIKVITSQSGILV